MFFDDFLITVFGDFLIVVFGDFLITVFGDFLIVVFGDFLIVVFDDFLITVFDDFLIVVERIALHKDVLFLYFLLSSPNEIPYLSRSFLEIPPADGERLHFLRSKLGYIFKYSIKILIFSIHGKKI